MSNQITIGRQPPLIASFEQFILKTGEIAENKVVPYAKPVKIDPKNSNFLPLK